MALKPLFARSEPYGVFDGYDQDYLTIKGGEVGRFLNVTYTFPPTTSSDKAAYDNYLGLSGNSGTHRVVISHTLTHTHSTYRPLFLLDEGIAGYGTFFTYVVGGACGTVVPNPNDLSGVTLYGPHTAVGTGKVTCWDQHGLYAVTLDAVADSLTFASNVSGGDALFANENGEITATESEAFDYDGNPASATIIGRFYQFSTGKGLVKTPAHIARGGAVVPTQLEFTFGIEG